MELHFFLLFVDVVELKVVDRVGSREVTDGVDVAVDSAIVSANSAPGRVVAAESMIDEIVKDEDGDGEGVVLVSGSIMVCEVVETEVDESEEEEAS